MELKDLQELRDEILNSISVNNEVDFIRLNKTVNNIDVDDFAVDFYFIGIEDVLLKYDAFQTDIIDFVSDFIAIINDVIEFQTLPFKCNDEEEAETNVKRFMYRLITKLKFELAKLKERTYLLEDTYYYDIYADYNNGLFSDISFDEFLNEYIIKGLSTNEAIRRLNYLKEIEKKGCDKMGICYCDWDLQRALERLKDKQSESTEATNDEPLQKQSASPAPIAPNDDKPENPDFSHMQSFQPEKELSLHNLYEFLIDEGVIRDVDEALFTDCIKHAYFNSLWDKGKRNQLKCVIRHLKDNFDKLWIENVAENLGKGKKVITSMNRDSFGDFENKLRDIL